MIARRSWIAGALVGVAWASVFVFKAIAERTAPTLTVYREINDLAPSTVESETRSRRPGGPRKSISENIRDVAAALSNLRNRRRCGEATTPYLPLQNAMKALVEAQSEQLAGLGAAEDDTSRRVTWRI